MRRFTPTPKTAADGGTVYGLLVADRRTALGMSREELAAKIQASPSAVMRIEEGHPPSAEIREKLTATLIPSHLARCNAWPLEHSKQRVQSLPVSALHSVLADRRSPSPVTAARLSVDPSCTLTNVGFWGPWAAC